MTRVGFDGPATGPPGHAHHGQDADEHAHDEPHLLAGDGGGTLSPASHRGASKKDDRDISDTTSILRVSVLFPTKHPAASKDACGIVVAAMSTSRCATPRECAELVLFPEAFVPCFPSNRWARGLSSLVMACMGVSLVAHLGVWPIERIALMIVLPALLGITLAFAPDPPALISRLAKRLTVAGCALPPAA